jgi:glucose/arabinose dehydrogenase
MEGGTPNPTYTMKISINVSVVFWGSMLTVLFPVRASPALERVANTTLQMPQVPQSFGYKTEKAFGNLSFSAPVAVNTPPGETNRVFVVEKGGKIFAITNLANPAKTLFLDISKRIVVSDAEGLFGIAFHPGYATNGYFYLGYNVRTTTGAGTGAHYRVARFQVSPDDPNAALADSELPLITQKNKSANRTCNDLAFGPDGYLYIAVGWVSSTTYPANHSQKVDGDLEGGILRVDVDKKPGSVPPNLHSASSDNYAVPADNPFVSATSFNGIAVDPALVRTEYYATGLRNPWRIAFDSATGQLYCSDAGETGREEINLIVKGGNYGWAFLEGTVKGPRASATPAGFGSMGPIHEYNHVGISVVIGGVVYRGDRLSQLQGAYIFGDYVTGNIWALRSAGTNLVPSQKLLSESGIVAYGSDPSNNDVLLVNYDSGSIKRLVHSATMLGTPLPATLADTGAFSDLQSLTPQAGIVPYDLNVPFWSDNAIKTRWFSVPNPNQKITFGAETSWLFPTGTVWIKNFDGVPSSGRRLETRFIVRNANGVYGVTYRWGNSTTNATLVPEEGLDEEFEIEDGGSKRKQIWHYPSRAECLTCHNTVSGLTLGFNSHQVNRPFNYPRGVENQIGALSDAGYFQKSVTNLHTLRALAPATNTSVSVEYRVHSYLAANCVQCHQPGGIGRGLFDARISTPLSLAGLVNGALLNPLGDLENRVIAPGSLPRSVLFSRVANLGEQHMPPLATSVLNERAIDLLRDWITSLLVVPPKDFALRLAAEIKNGQVQLQFTRPANRAVEIQCSDDLSGKWQALQVDGNEPVFDVSDTEVTVIDQATPARARFYRAEIKEP